MLDVTVIIPLWNRPAYMLDECLAALRAQRMRLRIIVVDNCSDTPIAAPADVELVRTPRRGSVGYARNFGLGLVQTPYVLFMDADDYLLPGALAYLHDVLDARPDAVAAVGSFLRLSEETGNLRPAEWPFEWMYAASRFPRLFALTNAYRCCTPMVDGVLLRTAAVRAAGGYEDCEPGQDWMLGISLALRGRVLMGDRTCFVVRQQTHTPTNTSGPRSFRTGWRMRSRARTRLRQDPLTPRWLRLSTPALLVAHLVLALGAVL